MWGFIAALVSGALMTVQGIFNAQVTKGSSVWVAAAFVQATAFVVCIVAWLVTGRDGNFAQLLKITPKYMLLGGVIGAFITFTVIQGMNTLGPAKAAIFIVTAQIVIAYVIELMGIFGVDKEPFSWRKIIGLVVIIGGIVTFKWD